MTNAKDILPVLEPLMPYIMASWGIAAIILIALRIKKIATKTNKKRRL